MFSRPASIANVNIADSPVILVAYWNGQPDDAVRRLDSIPVPPVVHRVLDVIVEDEDVCIAHDVEITAPRNVVRLYDRGLHAASILRSGARLHRRARLAIDLAAPDRFALVMRLLALGQRDERLDAPVLEIELERDERQAFLGNAPDHLANLLPPQQQLPLPHLRVVGGAAMAVGADVDVHHPHLAVLDARVAVAQVHAALANRLHLGPEKRDARLPRVENVVIVPRLPVFGDGALRLLALRFWAGHRWTIADGRVPFTLPSARFPVRVHVRFSFRQLPSSATNMELLSSEPT